MSDEFTLTLEAVLRRVLDAKLRSPWLDGEAAAGYLACSPGTLKTWRARGEGPRYHIINGKSVRYNVADLDAFVLGEANR